MQCPNCGNEIEFEARFSEMVVCASCRSSIIVDENAMRLAGTMSALAATPGPLWVGGSGTLKGHSFVVNGRVRYSYEGGYWDEWALTLDDGRHAWLAEDEGNFTLTRLKDMKVKSGVYAKAKPGSRMTLTGKSFHVDEKGIAKCEGAQGQVPFVVTEGAMTPYLDMSAAGGEFATLEFDLADDTARLFRGKRVPLETIKMDGEKPGWARVAEGAALSAGGHVEVTGAGQKKLSCYACGGTLDPKGDVRDAPAQECPYCGTENHVGPNAVECAECSTSFSVPAGAAAKLAVCPSCQTHLNIAGGDAKKLPERAPGRRPNIPFKLGQTFKLPSGPAVLTGHIRLHAYEDGMPYPYDEFMLYSEKTGYCWLVFDEGKWSIATRILSPPFVIAGRDDEAGDAEVIVPREGAKFTYEGKKYRVVEASLANTKIAWVAGQLPYIARVGDTVSYIDARSGDSMISAEWTEREIEYFISRDLSMAELEAMTGLEGRALGARSSLMGMGDGFDWTWVKVVAGLFLAINAVLLITAGLSHGLTNGLLGHGAIAAICFLAVGGHQYIDWD